MAIMTLTGTGIVGATDASTPGITHPSTASAEKSYGTIVRAKNSEGSVVAALVGKQSFAMSITGFSTNDGPELGDDIEVAGVSGKVTSVNIEKSVEDFSRFSAEGRGLPT